MPVEECHDNMKTCKDFCDRLSDYLDGDVCESECSSIEEHLRDCPPCDEMLRSFQASVRLCSEGVSDEVPEKVRERLRIFLREHCLKEGTQK